MEAGLVIVEIDGVGYHRLQQAIAAGFVPFLASLLESAAYQCYPWHCGLASDTPPVQASLMYGSCDGVPSYYWFDRRRQRRCLACNPGDLRPAEAQLAARAGRPPLLAGGSAYSCMLAGGALRTALTIAGTDLRAPRAGRPLLGALKDTVADPAGAVRLAREALQEILSECGARSAEWERTEDGVGGPPSSVVRRPSSVVGHRRYPLPSTLLFSLLRVLLNLIPREVAARATCRDMADGVPVIYTSLIGFDVVAHRHGPASETVLRVVHALDTAIRAIFAARTRAARDYTIVILSDHGMTPSLPFSHAFGEPFAAFVSRTWIDCAKGGSGRREPGARSRERGAGSRETGAGGREPGASAGSLPGSKPLAPSSSLLAPRSRLPPRWKGMWARVLGLAMQRVTAGIVNPGQDPFSGASRAGCGAQPEVVTVACGPLAQIWLRGRASGADFRQIEAMAPGFGERLAGHRGIGAVLVRDGERCLVLGPAGRATLRLAGAGACASGEVAVECQGTHPLAAYGDPALIARQVAAFAASEASGDVTCLATLIPGQLVNWSIGQRINGSTGQDETRTITFEEQFGAHGGLGGDQDTPFLVLPASIAFDPASVVRAADLYPLLYGLAHGGAKGDP